MRPAPRAPQHPCQPCGGEGCGKGRVTLRLLCTRVRTNMHTNATHACLRTPPHNHHTRGNIGTVRGRVRVHVAVRACRPLSLQWERALTTSSPFQSWPHHDSSISWSHSSDLVTGVSALALRTRRRRQWLGRAGSGHAAGQPFRLSPRMLPLLGPGPGGPA